MTPLVKERKHELSLAFTSAEMRIEVDATRLEQMLVNLLSNAAKYTPVGGRIQLIAGMEGDELVCRVRDNGVGVSPELLPRMFDLFAQADQSLARSEGGLGIGLALVRSLAELHGGSIAATSDGPGEGSEFILRLPSGLTAGAQDPDPSGRPEERPLRGLRVLVIDDNEDTATGIAKLLRVSGHAVRIAHSGADALELAREHEPEAVILDIGLPGMNGYEVAAQLRREACCKESLIIAVSGYGEEQARARSHEAGFDHHLVKPVNFDTILGLMDRASDRASN